MLRNTVIVHLLYMHVPSSWGKNKWRGTKVLMSLTCLCCTPSLYSERKRGKHWIITPVSGLAIERFKHASQVFWNSLLLGNPRHDGEISRILIFIDVHYWICAHFKLLSTSLSIFRMHIAYKGVSSTSRKTKAVSITRPVDGLLHVKELKSWFRNFLRMFVIVCTDYTALRRNNYIRTQTYH